jgi:hypothetical protein
MPTLSLDPGDAAGLTEMLEFLADWLAADRDVSGESLARCIGQPAYNLRDPQRRPGRRPRIRRMLAGGHRDGARVR